MSWQPIETAPKSVQFIAGRHLEHNDLRRQIWLARREDDRKGPAYYAGSQRIFPHHWMPLPEPPK